MFLVAKCALTWVNQTSGSSGQKDRSLMLTAAARVAGAGLVASGVSCSVISGSCRRVQLTLQVADVGC